MFIFNQEDTNLDSRFELEVTDFLDACLEKVLEDLKSNDPEYASDKEYVESNSQKLENAVSDLPKATRDFIKDYLYKNKNVRRLEREYAYYRGYTDCNKLLKMIGTL